MHCALLIEEIVSRILDEADMKSRWALARTCRSFTEPALDAIWATRTDAWALGGLMPKDLWTIDSSPGDENSGYPAEYVLSFAPGVDVASVRDFGDRFMYHAKRVRDFVIDHRRQRRKGDYYVDPYVVAAWAKQPHLFPQLRALAASINTNFTWFGNAFDLLVQAPCLATISVNFGDAMYHLHETTEQCLLEACPQLETLELEYSERRDNSGEPWMKRTRHLPGVLHQMITTAARLRGLRLAESPMHFTTLLHLASLPELRILVLGEIIEIPPDLTSLPVSCFRALRALRIHDTTSHTRLARSLVQCCGGSPLMELHVSMDVGASSELNSQDLRDLFRVIGQHTRLEHLRISLEWVSVNDGGPFFDALPRLEFLTSLWISKPVFGTSLYTLLDLVKILSLYPRLVRWHMGTYDKQDGISTALSRLLYVLCLRPSLRLLPIVVNSSELPSEDIVANFGTHQYGPYLQVPCTSELQEIITKLLPHVKTVTYSYQQRGLLEEALKPFEAYV